VSENLIPNRCPKVGRLIGLLAAALLPTTDLHADRASPALTASVATHGSTTPALDKPPSRLRVLTLNTAHGRKDRLNQLLLSRSALRENLRGIAVVLDRSDADVVALQEADGPSRWSGRFDHVGLVADEAGFAWRFRGSHAESWLFDYGTALLSRVPFMDTESRRFEPTPPTPRKGYVIGEVAWPDSDTGLTVDIVSVHFDYLSDTARDRQFEELAGELDRRNRPVIVLGDFNSEWSTPDSPVRRFAESAGLAGFRPDRGGLATYEDQRIDWILISHQFRFLDYRVLPDLVSDHRAVIAEIGLAGH
jgi:endonuclease/exonuclease/phosphatase family metal-dependent hydrolase